MHCRSSCGCCGPKDPSLKSIKEIEDHLGRPLTQQEFTHAWNDQIRTYLHSTSSTADLSKLIAASVAIATQQNSDIAYNTAAIAVDNNFLVLAAYGLTTAYVGYTAYDVYNTFQENGVEAALNKLGIEMLKGVTGCVTGHYAGKALYKIGSITYPTAAAALDAVMIANPGLKTVLGNFTDTLAISAEKISQTAMGQYVTRITNAVAKIEGQLLNAQSKIINKIDRQLCSGVEGLVEPVVPGSALSKLQSKPFGVGHTGRFIPNSLKEKLVLEEILANTHSAFIIDIGKGMTDKRWHQNDGWVKMGWESNKIHVHFVAQWKDGIINAIDDLKFKK